MVVWITITHNLVISTYLYDINFRGTILFDFKRRRIFKSTRTLTNTMHFVVIRKLYWKV